MRRGAIVGLVASLVAATAAAVFGCDAVPVLTFADDGSASSGGGASDGGAPADGSTGCPAQPPPGVTACCGAVSCIGDCESHCGDCSKCSSDKICCSRNGTVTCRPPGAVCN